MGTRKSRERQEPLWYGTELPTAPGHPFYNRLNEALDKAGFDSHCEESCAGFTTPNWDVRRWRRDYTFAS